MTQGSLLQTCGICPIKRTLDPYLHIRPAAHRWANFRQVCSLCAAVCDKLTANAFFVCKFSGTLFAANLNVAHCVPQQISRTQFLAHFLHFMHRSKTCCKLCGALVLCHTLRHSFCTLFIVIVLQVTTIC